MFGKLFGLGRYASPPKPGLQLAMPVFGSNSEPDPSQLTGAWSRLWPNEPPLSISKSDQGVLQCDHAGRTLMVAVLPAPIPKGDIDAACAASWMWPDAATALLTHKAHAIVAAPEQASPAELASTITRMVCAISRCSDMVGVYWGNGGQVHKPELFVQLASESLNDGSLPVPLWVGLRISGAGPSGPFTLTTKGMASFGHKELEIIETTMSIGDLRILAYDTILYLLTNGPVIRHGQTFGRTSDERFKTEHATSKFVRGQPVLRLHVP